LIVKVGSTALKERNLNLKRTPKDVDFFSDSHKHSLPSLIEGKHVEVFVHSNLSKYEWSGSTASLDELYTIKISHIFWDLNNKTWDKHFHDILFFQFRTEAKFIPELYELLYSIWENKYGRKRANLNQSPKDFFNNKIARIYEHDSIHRSVAYYEMPLFNKILRDGYEVAVDKQKFDALLLTDRFKLVREEVYATALERQIFPSNGQISSGEAYLWALKKTITSFSKGWFPLFIALNLKSLYKPDIDFIKRSKDNENLLELVR
jgi:hypothetical protein